MQGKKWSTPEREREVIELYSRHESAIKVAAIVGCGCSTVNNILVRNGIPRVGRHHGNGRRRKPKPEPKVRKSNCCSKYCPALIVMLYKSFGQGVNEISDGTGYPSNCVRNVLSRRGVFKPTRRTFDKGDFDLDEIEREYLSGVSGREIAKRIGVNPSTVSRWMRERGTRLGKGAHQSHYKAGGTIEKICKYCGVTFYTNRDETKYCSVTCANRSHHLRNTSHRRRADYHNAAYDKTINIRRLYERDGGICQICGVLCDWDDKSYGNCGPTYPSIDHIVPFAKGGAHVWLNVQLACCRCNSLKGAHDNDEVLCDAS